MAGIQVRVEGLDRLRRQLDPRIADIPLRQFFTKATLLVQAAARKLAPVDTGRLRSSITTRVDPGRLPAWGEVGSNVNYALFVHEGTRPHWPPVNAVAGWARRHGIPPFLAARAISRRGTRPRRFLTIAFRSNLGRLQRLVNQLASDLEQRMGGR